VPDVQWPVAVQVRAPDRRHPRCAIRAAAGDDEAGQSQFGDTVRGNLSDAGRNLADDAHRCRCCGTGVGDPGGQRRGVQPGDPMRRIGRHRREDLQTGQAHPDPQRCPINDDAIRPQLRRRPRELRNQIIGGHPGKDLISEVLTHLRGVGRPPPWPVRVPEPGDDPLQLDQCVRHGAYLRTQLLERGPTR
jgi:hypothetical protein